MPKMHAPVRRDAERRPSFHFGAPQPPVGWRVLVPFLLLTLSVGSTTATGGEHVRPSALAGTWYPADPAELTTLVDGLLDRAGSRRTDSEAAVPIRALILPHAGYRYSGATAAKALASIRGRHFARVVILAPSHHSAFGGLSIADVDAYRTPLGEVPLDEGAVARLRRSELVTSHPDAHAREHSIEIELPLLQRALAPGWHLVPILVGRLSPSSYASAAALLRPLADGETLVVASSDFTHYGPRFDYLPFPLNDQTPEQLHALDAGAIDQIRAKDAPGLLGYQRETGITVCGIRPIALLLTMLPPDARIDLADYQTSGAITGDYRNSVSYASLTVASPEALDAPREAETGTAAPGAEGKTATPDPALHLEPGDFQLLHRLARMGIDQAVLGESAKLDATLTGLVDQLPERLKRPAGAFVTLKEGEALRGCIGYILPRRPLYLAIVENGYNAAHRDPRFQPVRPDELGGLSVEISVLTPPEPISGYQDFQVGRQGVILSKDGRRAVFLPEVATEQGWDRAQTLEHLAIKAGLPANAWKEGATFQVFESLHDSAPYRADPASPSAKLTGD